MNLDNLESDILHDCVELCVRMELEFYKKGGIRADKKLSIGGHRVPCSICGRNGRRYVPNGKPICEKCWDDSIESAIAELVYIYAMNIAADSVLKSLEYEQGALE